METKKNQIYKISFCAVLVALASVLSLIKVYKLPLGGSITVLSMLPIIFIGVLLGAKWGMISSFLYSIIQLGFGITIDGVLGWGLTPLSLVGTIFLDYIIAFSVLGLVGFLKSDKPSNVALATAGVLILRFVCHLISGGIIFNIWCEWDNAWLYSLCYNGSFMLPELIFTVAAAAIIFSFPTIKRLKSRITDSF